MRLDNTKSCDKIRRGNGNPYETLSDSFFDCIATCNPDHFVELSPSWYAKYSWFVRCAKYGS